MLPKISFEESLLTERREILKNEISDGTILNKKKYEKCKYFNVNQRELIIIVKLKRSFEKLIKNK